MKINFGLLGLAAAQSGDDRWEDNSYDYDISSDRWSNENQYSLDEANAGITFGVMARVTKQQNANHFQKALKLSCWNSNMIRDMNNDNKFSVYFNDQVEYKRFQPGVNTADGTINGGTVDTTAGADDLSWLYAVGDLRTGYNHQYGFEHSDSAPYFDENGANGGSASEVNRLGHSTALDGKNNNRLRQLDEAWADQAYRSVTNGNTATGTDGIKRTVTKNTVPVGAGIRVDDVHHGVRPNERWSHRKWGYQSDNVERAASHGYDVNTVVYHFGHHDNKDNDANRPNMRYATSSDPVDETSTTDGDRDKINRNAHEFDFWGFKDDWRYSLRMGGCLYEAARWVYDESSFHRTGRLTYTDDTLFMDDPFNPMDGTDIFGSHQYAAHTSLNSATANVNLAQLSSALVTAQGTSAAGFASFYNSTCGTSGHGGTETPGDVAHGCDSLVETMGAAYVNLTACFKQNESICQSKTIATASAASGDCIHNSSGPCYALYTTFTSARDAVFDDSTSGCLYTATGSNCPHTTTTNFNTYITDLKPFYNDDLALYMTAKEQEGLAQGALAVAQGTVTSGNSGSIFIANQTIFDQANPSTNWTNAGMTNTSSGEAVIGDCNGSSDLESCQYANVATPSSGGVFADVHWVHVFNAHIFPLQDVGYYQYDQTLGISNVNEDNDSITSRDGYGYNIYQGNTDNFYVMRDVWGVRGSTAYPDTNNNAPPDQFHDQTDASTFHNQYGTVNIGDTGKPAAYTTANGYTASLANDFYPILTKTRRKIEDFNVVMANPTYEGHGFLNFVATYHDHTENFNDNTPTAYQWHRQVGKRFLSTIGGLTTASNKQRNVCRALKDGIDSYRMNGIAPYKGGSNTTNGHDSDTLTASYNGDGHDDAYLYPLGPGPAGDYGNGQRCGAAMYENFGDWFLRPAQTYSAYHNYDSKTTVTTATEGWQQDYSASQGCQDAVDANGLCLGGMSSYNYWAFILSEGYNPIGPAASATADPGTAHQYMSRHELWRNGSLHYDRRGADGSTGSLNVSGSSGRGFAISSFPHNELGKDFRFNIRTLHNMGNGVAKQFYQIQNLADTSGNEWSGIGGTQPTAMNTLRTSNLRTTETVWSYYFYAVDTIKIAFPEFVARVNHCDRHSHRNSSHCTTEIDGTAVSDYLTNTENGNPDTSGASDGINKSSTYPGYANSYPHRRLGFQDIIIDGVTMKKTDNQYDSRQSRTGDDDWHKQYNFARGLRGDDHTRATLHYDDTEFANEDGSLTEYTTKMCGADSSQFNMSNNIIFHPILAEATQTAGAESSYQGYTDSYQPLKPCASWCALDEYTGTVVHGAGIDSSKQTVDDPSAATPVLTGMSSVVASGTTLSEYGGICGRILRIDGLLQTYDELHNRQYGTIQEIWVQLQYAYQESLDNANRTTSNVTCNKYESSNTSCDQGIRKVQSPFPNVFFSAPEVVDIRGFCPSSNMKCRGYMTDQHQPYGGSRNHVERVHWNGPTTRFTDQVNAFGANQLHATGGQAQGYGVRQSGNDWTMDRDYRGDSKWPWNHHTYTSASTDGTAYGGGSPGTKYTGRDYDHAAYELAGSRKK